MRSRQVWLGHEWGRATDVPTHLALLLCFQFSLQRYSFVSSLIMFIFSSLFGFWFVNLLDFGYSHWFIFFFIFFVMSQRITRERSLCWTVKQRNNTALGVFFSLFRIIFYFVCMNVLPLRVQVYCVHVWCPQRSERATRSPRTGVTVVGCHVGAEKPGSLQGSKHSEPLPHLFSLSGLLAPNALSCSRRDGSIPVGDLLPQSSRNKQNFPCQ